MSRLDAALEEVRRAFRRAKKPDHLKNRMWFIQEREEARLLGRPREELTVQDLCDYVDECGGKLEYPELGYFLPRICEVLAAGVPLHPVLGWFCTLDCLKYANYPKAWPDDQAEAVQKYVEAMLATFVETPRHFPECSDLGEMLWMAGRGGIDMERLTLSLHHATAQALARALADWIASDCFVTGDMKADEPDRWRQSLPNAYADGEAFTVPVLDWLVSIEPWRLLSNAAVREADPEMRERLRRVAAYCAAWPEAQASSA